jgi:hypothetical protein
MVSVKGVEPWNSSDSRTAPIASGVRHAAPPPMPPPPRAATANSANAHQMLCSAKKLGCRDQPNRPRVRKPRL